MKHLNSFNESKSSLDISIFEKIFSALGIKVTSESIISTNKFSKLLCNMAVKDGLFEKVGDNEFKIKK